MGPRAQPALLCLSSASRPLSGGAVLGLAWRGPAPAQRGVCPSSGPAIVADTCCPACVASGGVLDLGRGLVLEGHPTSPGTDQAD